MPEYPDPNTTPRLLFESKFIRVWNRDHWEWASRPQSTHGVHVIAITPDRRIVLVEQYRYPVDAPVLDLPAGMVERADPSEKDLLEVANLELVEETGYRAGTLKLLAVGSIAPGLVDEMQGLVLATDLEKVGDGGGIDKERILVHEAPLDGYEAWLDQRRAEGMVVDLLVYLALSFAPAMKNPP